MTAPSYTLGTMVRPFSTGEIVKHYPSKPYDFLTGVSTRLGSILKEARADELYPLQAEINSERARHCLMMEHETIRTLATSKGLGYALFSLHMSAPSAATWEFRIDLIYGAYTMSLFSMGHSELEALEDVMRKAALEAPNWVAQIDANRPAAQPRVGAGPPRGGGHRRDYNRGGGGGRGGRGGRGGSGRSHGGAPPQ